MKIVGNTDQAWRLPIDAAAFLPSTGAGGFGEILKQTLTQAAAAGPASASAASGGVYGTEPISDDAAVACLEGYIDLLEGYCRQLADPRVSLKGLEPSVRRLEEGRAPLAAMLGSLPGGDGLKDVLNQTLVTAEIEIMRFRRGDYRAA